MKESLLSNIETPPLSTRSDASSSSSLSIENPFKTGVSSMTCSDQMSSMTISRLTPSSPSRDHVSVAAVASSSGQVNVINISSMSITSSSSAHLIDQSLSQCPPSSSCSTSNNVSVVTISSSSLSHSRSSSPSSSSLSSPATASEGVSILKSSSSSSNNSHSVKLKISGVNTQSPSCSTSTVNSPSIVASKGKKNSTTKSGKFLPCKDRQYDCDKHCGVKTEGMDKECTRSLTCKTHSLTLRRNVTGRSKSFDDLLEEHRQAKEEAMRLAGKEVKPTKKQLKAMEMEAKRALNQESKKDVTSRKSTDKSVMSPANSLSNLSAPSPLTIKTKRPTPAPSPANSVTSNLVSIDSPLGSLVNETCSSISSKKSVLNHVTAKVKGKKKQKLQQQSDQRQEEKKPDVTSVGLASSDEHSLLQTHRLPLMMKPKPRGMTIIEGSDGMVYLRHPPRPLAVNSFNCRLLTATQVSSPNGDASCYGSSRLFNRSSDSALKSVFQLNSQLDSSANKMPGSSLGGTFILTTTPSIPVCHFSKNNSSNLSPKKGKKAKDLKLNSQVSLESGLTSPLQPSNGHNIVLNTTGGVNKRKQSLVGLSAPSLTSLLESGLPSNSSSNFSTSPSFSSMVQLNSNSPLVVNNAVSSVSGTTSIVISSSPVKKMRNNSISNGYGLSTPTLESLLDAGITPSSPSLISPVGSESKTLPISSLSSTHTLLASTLESGFNSNLLSPNNHLMNHQLLHSGVNQQQQFSNQSALRPQSPQKTRNAHNSPHLISLLDSGPTALNSSSWTAKRSSLEHNPNSTSWEPSFECQ